MAVCNLDADGIVFYEWDFGDQSLPDTGPILDHTYSAPGFYDATLTVTDFFGKQSSTSVPIFVLGNSNPIAVIEVDKTSGEAPLTVTFDGSGSIDDGEIVSYTWNFSDGTQLSGPIVQKTFFDVGFVIVELKVTDLDGNSAFSSKKISVDRPNLPPTSKIFTRVDRGVATESQFLKISSYPTRIFFNSRFSEDSDGVIRKREWITNLGDKFRSNTFELVIENSSVDEISLIVTDEDGAQSTSVVMLDHSEVVANCEIDKEDEVDCWEFGGLLSNGVLSSSAQSIILNSFSGNNFDDSFFSEPPEIFLLEEIEGNIERLEINNFDIVNSNSISIPVAEIINLANNKENSFKIQVNVLDFNQESISGSTEQFVIGQNSLELSSDQNVWIKLKNPRSSFVKYIELTQTPITIDGLPDGVYSIEGRNDFGDYIDTVILQNGANESRFLSPFDPDTLTSLAGEEKEKESSPILLTSTQSIGLLAEPVRETVIYRAHPTVLSDPFEHTIFKDFACQDIDFAGINFSWTSPYYPTAEPDVIPGSLLVRSQNSAGFIDVDLTGKDRKLNVICESTPNWNRELKEFIAANAIRCCKEAKYWLNPLLPPELQNPGACSSEGEKAINMLGTPPDTPNKVTVSIEGVIRKNIGLPNETDELYEEARTFTVSHELLKSNPITGNLSSSIKNFSGTLVAQLGEVIVPPNLDSVRIKVEHDTSRGCGVYSNGDPKPRIISFHRPEGEGFNYLIQKGVSTATELYTPWINASNSIEYVFPFNIDDRSITQNPFPVENYTAQYQFEYEIPNNDFTVVDLNLYISKDGVTTPELIDKSAYQVEIDQDNSKRIQTGTFVISLGNLFLGINSAFFLYNEDYEFMTMRIEPVYLKQGDPIQRSGDSIFTNFSISYNAFDISTADVTQNDRYSPNSGRISAFGSRDVIEFLKRIKSSFTPFKMNDISLPFGGRFFGPSLNTGLAIPFHAGHKDGRRIDLRYPLDNNPEICPQINGIPLGTCANDFVNYYSQTNIDGIHGFQKLEDFRLLHDYSLRLQNLVYKFRLNTVNEIDAICRDPQNSTNSYQGEPCPEYPEEEVSRIVHFVNETRSKVTNLINSEYANIESVIIGSGSAYSDRVSTAERRAELITTLVESGSSLLNAINTVRAQIDPRFHWRALILGETSNGLRISDLGPCVANCFIIGVSRISTENQLRGKVIYDNKTVHHSHIHVSLKK